MVLTFKSTISEYVQLIIRDADGSKRVATLERDLVNPRKWSGSVDHPGGTRYAVDTFSHDAVDALDKLSHAMVSKEVDYKALRGRNYRPAPGLRDPNVRVDDMGNNLTAPIRRNV